MKSDKQTNETEKKKLKNRILRDVVFIILGITFTIISIISASK